MSSEEYGLVENEVIKDISTKMKDTELYTKACESTTESMTRLLNTILGDDVTITISF